ncbi:hypothetical protein RND71_032766 [Anisodus tanguticus]|uniref:RRM domain-containing protein n=1 Tax=Anisodus tanguticus TaxID=243964 RepID=A0AAE1R9U9_9SOLA|nr:hypothetical protein RND71_032766 [Anisodus tanguticus]
MAFLNKIGNILKQSVVKNTNLELSASNASLFQAIRSMSSSKLFVGGLSYGTDESSLKEAFSQYGEFQHSVISKAHQRQSNAAMIASRNELALTARVILDRDTGRSRGFGFISFPSSEEATSAMQAMDGQDLHGRRIKVNYATEKRRAGFGGGYGGFNYGGEGGGYAAGNYGGGGGAFSGGYSSGGGGGYGGNSGYNYGREGGNFAGAGGYPTNNYGGGGGGFSGGNSSAGGYGSYGGGSNYGNNNGSPVEGGNYGSTPNNTYSGQGSSFSGGYGSGNDFVGVPSNNNGLANTGFGGSSEESYNGGQEQLSADQGTQSVNEDLGQETSEGNYRDDDDEPKDYANTRG